MYGQQERVLEKVWFNVKIQILKYVTLMQEKQEMG